MKNQHREMAAAAGDKNLWIVGGGKLAGQFYDHGLLDDLIKKGGRFGRLFIEFIREVDEISKPAPAKNYAPAPT